MRFRLALPREHVEFAIRSAKWTEEVTGHWTTFRDAPLAILGEAQGATVAAYDSARCRWWIVTTPPHTTPPNR